MIGTYPRNAWYGKKTTEAVALDKCYISPSYTRDYSFVVRMGRDREVMDVEGNWYLDFGAGIAVTSTGHCHPKVVDAIKDQADMLIHMSGTDFYYKIQAQLAEKLTKISGLASAMVFFGNSGAEAVEAAMKLARFHTQRPGFIAFTGAFHGRTMGALSLTASKAVQSERYLPLQPVAHTPYPNCRNCWFGLHEEVCKDDGCKCVDYIEQEIILRGVMPAKDCAAIVMEPIQGEGGYIIPPVCWYRDINHLAQEYDLLIICDEVQAGMGRTGQWFAHHNFPILDGIGNMMSFRPDIITFAKGIASGMPLGGIIADEEIISKWTYGAHASTFGGNPISCAAALATIKVIEDEGLLNNAALMGDHLRTRLQEIEDDLPVIENVRGLGLMTAIDVIDDRNLVISKCFDKGLILLGCGANGIRFCPALNVTKEEVDTCVNILSEALNEVF